MSYLALSKNTLKHVECGSDQAIRGDSSFDQLRQSPEWTEARVLISDGSGLWAPGFHLLRNRILESYEGQRLLYIATTERTTVCWPRPSSLGSLGLHLYAAP